MVSQEPNKRVRELGKWKRFHEGEEYSTHNNEREIDIIVVGKGGGGVANQNLVSSQLSSSSEVPNNTKTIARNKAQEEDLGVWEVGK